MQINRAEYPYKRETEPKPKQDSQGSPEYADTYTRWVSNSDATARVMGQYIPGGATGNSDDDEFIGFVLQRGNDQLMCWYGHDDSLIHFATQDTSGTGGHRFGAISLADLKTVVERCDLAKEDNRKLEIRCARDLCANSDGKLEIVFQAEHDGLAVVKDPIDGRLRIFCDGGEFFEDINDIHDSAVFDESSAILTARECVDISETIASLCEDSAQEAVENLSHIAAAKCGRWAEAKLAIPHVARLL